MIGFSTLNNSFFKRVIIAMTSVASMNTLVNMSLASEKAVTFTDVNDVVSHWESKQNLYVRGNLGVSAEALSELEIWLDENAQNWTVVLLQNAKGQSWEDTRGLNYFGMDAVDNAIGRGLSNSVDFNRLKDDGGKRNGVVFVMFLEERKFSYFADEAYDDRFLGDDAWVGNLDSKAIKVMRGGGGVVNAVKDTIKVVDGKLDQAKNREEARREQAIVNKKQTQEWVVREAEQMNLRLSEIAKNAGDIKSNTGSEDGDIANPPLNDWRQVINEAVANPDPYLAKKALLETDRGMKSQRDMIRSWYAFPEDLMKLEDKVAELQVDKNFSEGNTRLVDLKNTLNVAKDAHSKADSSHMDLLEGAQNEYLYFLEKNDRVRESRLKQEEQDRVLSAQMAEAEQQRKDTIKTTAIAGGGLGSLALLGLGVFSNKRRRKRKEVAEQLYAEWKEAMSDRVDKLFEVMDRASIVVGSERDLPERGYQGETLERSLSAIKQVDKSFVLTASVDKALSDAEELIYPNSIPSRSVNVFSRSRYDDALDLLEKKPLGSHLPIDEIKVADRGEEKMLGSRENAENVELSFTELIAEFDKTVAGAEADLDIVESAWENISKRSEGLAKQLAVVSEQDQELENLALDDGLFRLDGLFEEWLPLAEEYQMKGIELGKSDPVSALSDKIKHGERMTKEMQAMIQSVVKFRADELSSIERGEKELSELERDPEWVRERLADFDETLDEISRRGMNASVEGELAEYRGEMFRLRAEVTQACELAQTSLVTLPKSIEKAAKSVQNARSEIAKDLGLGVDEILVELDTWNPDMLLADAEQLRLSTQKSLDNGRVNQAQDFTDQSVEHVEESGDLVAETLEAHKSYPAEMKEVTELIKKAAGLRDAGVNVMGGLVGKYSRGALQVDPEDNSDGNFLDVEEALQGAYGQLQKDKSKAEEYQHKGWVLHASQSLENAKNAYEHVKGLSEFIQKRKEDLHDLELKNQQIFEAHSRDVLSLADVMKDPRVTRSTQGYYKELERIFELVKQDVHAEKESNPFMTLTSLTEIEDRVLAIKSSVEGDKGAYASTQSSIAQLEQQYAVGGRLVSESKRDGIADSERTEQSVVCIKQAKGLLEKHQRDIKEKHHDWAELFDEVQSSYRSLSEAVIVLKEELSRAQSALSVVRAGSRSVSEAMHWSGSYGVRISGHYGKESLQRAQIFLDNGDYTGASQYASTAQREARSAVSDAESKVARIKRQRAEAERERRRVRNRSRQSNIGVGSSSVGVKSSNSSSSRSSRISRRSSSRSSSGAKDSGFSRSGW